VRQTDEEHTKLIKELGAYFKSHRLKTKMLLGDTADANGFAFVDNATEDPGARPYVGAVSFHSWRGWENETLERWNEAAKKMGVPLLVAEGSIDASAWRVPAIFEESSYALMEIDLYVRILNICQPRSILQWQLTSDYSVLAGGGVFGNDSVPLHPTRRFWNLKQLGLTPVGLRIFETHCDHQDVSYAVLGDLSAGKCAIHLVNNAAARMVRITGLPANMDQFEIYVTGPENQMKRVQQVVAHNGELTFKAEAVSFISLIKK